ncbi:unnamed protein product [Thlaspi arvense]|uniref:Bulb-type lectin domain-containing protein n=1 Tax=Thlaspi arvense TaxID=13288 RepID=A0AAU9T3L7_THLAR|nr:unnamed protein product [Thlaspi arvense]
MAKIPSLFWVSLFLLSSSFSVSLDYSVITPRDSLTDGDTLSSTDDVFQLGFFSFDQEEQPQHRFLGLWYKQPYAVIWVANRNNPLYGTSGFLNLSSRGDLQLFDGEQRTLGLPQLILRKRGDPSYSYRLGSWNGLSFTGAPAMGRENSLFDYKFMSSEQEVNYSWTPRRQIVSRLVLNNTGKLQRFIQSKQHQWKLANTAPEDECDYYSICGAYAVCGINSKHTASCSCLQGFKPKSGRKWNISRGADGCVHEFPTNCGKKDIFVRIKCSSNCSCTAYANTDIREGGKGCLLWFGDLVDMREYSSFGQDVYIRMGFAKREFKGKEKVGMVVGSVIGIAVVLVAVFACFRKKLLKRCRGENWRKGIGEEDMDLPILDIKTISLATDDFSHVNFLGRGGFGPVYKVWKLWVEDRAIEVPEEDLLEETCVVSEVLRCIHVALLCVQQKPEDRPNMASVVLMFGSDGSLPDPKQPGYFTSRSVPDLSSSLSLRSVNEVSITMLQGR